MTLELAYISAATTSLIAIAGAIVAVLLVLVLGLVGIGRPQAKRPNLRRIYALTLGLTAVALMSAIIAAFLALA